MEIKPKGHTAIIGQLTAIKESIGAIPDHAVKVVETRHLASREAQEDLAEAIRSGRSPLTGALKDALK